MPRSRFRGVLASFFIFAIICFLWLPVLRLFATSRVLDDLFDVQKPANILFSPLARDLLFNTLCLSIGAAMLSMLLAAPVALVAARGAKKIRPLILFLCASPLALPPTLMATAYLELSRLPPPRSAASLAAENALSISSLFIAAPTLAASFFPIATFALWAALQSIPRESEDAARLFGSKATVWRGVLIPWCAPAAAGAASVIAAMTMWEMGAPDLLDVRTYSVQIYRAFSAGGDATHAALASLPMLFLGTLFFVPTWRAWRFYDRWKIEAIESRAQCATLLQIAGAFFVLLASPLAPLAVFLWQSRSAQTFIEVWDANRNDISNTLLAPSLASIGIVLIALMLVLLLRECSLRMQRVVMGFLLAPLLFAPILLAVAILQFYNQPIFDWIYESRYGLLLVGFTSRFFPLGVLWLHEAVRRVPQTYHEAARGVGASGFFIAHTIWFPLLSPATVALLAVLFAMCAGELSLAVLLNAPGGQTLPVPIFNQMHIGATAQAAALSLTLSALGGGVLLALLGVAAKLQRR